MQTISTPVNRDVTSFPYEVAPAGARILAFLLDSVFLAIYLTIIIFFVEDNIDVIDGWWIWLILVVIPAFAFRLIFELMMKGQTPGKRIMGIRVVRLDGTKPNAVHYFLRWICGPIDFVFLFGAVAIIIIASGGKGQRLGDIIAGTCVVRSSARANNAAGPSSRSYSPVFPQVIRLDSYYIELIQRALGAHHHHDNFTPVLIVTQKIKSLLEIKSDLPPVQFLSTVVKDYNHLNT